MRRKRETNRHARTNLQCIYSCARSSLGFVTLKMKLKMKINSIAAF